MVSLAINRSGSEVKVRPVAVIACTSERLGFSYCDHYTVSLCWMSPTGEICSYGTPSYSGFSNSKAVAEQSRIVAEHAATAVML